MNKEIKDRLDKLENELKESKNEIHSLKSSVSLTIERGIRKLLSRFTRKQLILGFVIALFLISIIGIAGTVTKTYTFSSGDVVSASKINTNFDNLYTLVNGNLDDSNISGISGSKITSGTVAAARLDNLSGSKITSGTVAAARIDNLDGSKITSGTVAAARIDNLTASIITSGVFDNSTIPKPANHITIFTRRTSSPQNGSMGGRTGVDNICKSIIDTELINMFNNSCTNIRAFISVSSNDEIRDFPSIYSVPTNVKVRSENGRLIANTWSGLLASNSGGDPTGILGTLYGLTGFHGGEQSVSKIYWTGSNSDGSLANNCSGWTDGSGYSSGKVGEIGFVNERVYQRTDQVCETELYQPLFCICF